MKNKFLSLGLLFFYSLTLSAQAATTISTNIQTGGNITASGILGIGTTSPVSQFTLDTYTTNQSSIPQYVVKGLLDATGLSGGGLKGGMYVWDTAGTGNTNINGFRVDLNAGYTGSGLTRAADFSNLIAGADTLGVADIGGNMGASFDAQGFGGSGDNVGVYSIADGALGLNIGVFGRSIEHTTNTNIANIGVIGIGGHYPGQGTQSQIGGYFTSGASGTFYTNNTLANLSTALLLDNQVEAVPLIVGRVNYVKAFEVTSTGGIVSTSTSNSVNFWKVLASDGSNVFNIDTTNQRIGIGSSTPVAMLSVTASSTVLTSPFISFNSTTSPVFNVLPNGSVGVGTTSPAENFVVTNPATTASMSLRSAGSSIGAGNIRFDMYNGDGNRFSWQYAGSGGTALKLQYNGATKDLFSSTGQLGVGTNVSTLNNMLNVQGSSAIGNTYYAQVAPGDGLIVEGIVGIGTTTPTASLQVTATTSNATTTIEIGKSGQSKGTCLVMYDKAGTVQYVSIQAGAFVISATSCR